MVSLKHNVYDGESLGQEVLKLSGQSLVRTARGLVMAVPTFLLARLLPDIKEEQLVTLPDCSHPTLSRLVEIILFGEISEHISRYQGDQVIELAKTLKIDLDLSSLEVAHPQYISTDVGKQVRNSDGQWLLSF